MSAGELKHEMTLIQGRAVLLTRRADGTLAEAEVHSGKVYRNRQGEYDALPSEGAELVDAVLFQPEGFVLQKDSQAEAAVTPVEEVPGKVAGAYHVGSGV